MSSHTTEAPETAASPSRPAVPTEKQHVTFEEYLRSSSEDVMTEWVDGEVIRMAPVAIRHQEIVVFLVQALGLYVAKHQAGVVLPAPIAMKLEKLARGREPDLLFVSQERTHLLEKTYLNGPADLVVEIVSPESVGRDRGEKFVEYEEAGIREYWLIDPERESAEFYELDQERGRYRAAVTEPEGVYQSRVVPGFFVRVAWLWQTPSPTLAALRELKLL